MEPAWREQPGHIRPDCQESGPSRAGSLSRPAGPRRVLCAVGPLARVGYCNCGAMFSKGERLACGCVAPNVASDSAVIYRVLFNVVLRRLPVEVAHRLAATSTRAICRVPVIAAILRRFVVAQDRALRVEALGLSFPSPLGAAAGLDKNGTWFESLGLLGFGFVEVGTVTATPQRGNPMPRVFRLTGDRALLNKMGFPNDGVDAVSDRLERRSGRLIVGVNVGKGASTPIESAAADYRAVIKRAAGLCDYLVVNVSSPNTPGLQTMQAVDLLRPLLIDIQKELRKAKPNLPLLLKIGPDTPNHQIDAVADLALELSLAGIVAVNTTEDRGILSRPEDVAHVIGGGISGPPLRARAIEVLERLYARVEDRLVLVSVGGVSDAEDAWERIIAGATLVQAHAGFIYGGPGWPHQINRGLARRVQEAGAASIQDVIGSKSPGTSRNAFGLRPTAQDVPADGAVSLST